MKYYVIEIFDWDIPKTTHIVYSNSEENAIECIKNKSSNSDVYTVIAVCDIIHDGSYADKIPSVDLIMLRGPRTDSNGNKIPVEIRWVRYSDGSDLSEYSFLRSYYTYEEWVPTKELALYKLAEGIK